MTDTPAETFQTQDADPEGDRTFCAVHPERETSLRCNNCGRYMCTQCAVKTPVGYRCRECVRQQQDVYFTANTADYVVGGVTAALCSLGANFLAEVLPPLFTLLLAVAVGGFIPQVVTPLVKRRRGRYMHLVVAAGVALGALPIVAPLLGWALAGAPLTILLWPLLFNIVMISVTYGWFRRGPSI
ncbi:MAG: hypothetical protein JXN59_16260 [Anaerolineae bacterium]|nr:hypothetical protein [Anaerolineae bacterium]